MSGGRIDCYLDIASIFSYLAAVRLLADLEKLAAQGVQVDFHPVFLGGIMQKSGNQPPWMLPAKANYLAHDSKRAARGVIASWATPANLMELARTLSPLRALLYIKATYAPAVFHNAMLCLFRRFWTPPHAVLADDAVLASALADATDAEARRVSGLAAGRPLFGEGDVRRIMDARDAMRDVLSRETAAALALGAFGAPWLWVTDSRGNAEPFFGSDRFGQIYRHLGIAYQDVEVLPPASRL